MLLIKNITEKENIIACNNNFYFIEIFKIEYKNNKIIGKFTYMMFIKLKI